LLIPPEAARATMVNRRSLHGGFAGVDNPLCHVDKTPMLLPDAKGLVCNIVRRLTGGGYRPTSHFRCWM
jgi:NAD/NADP transhydrogenase beta subunit